MCDKNKEFWEEKHKEDNRYWLTDSEPDYVYKLHGLKIFMPQQNILEIGVGTGRSIRKLAEWRHKVFAVDISETALEKIKSHAIPIQIYEKNAWPKNIIDIALCHLVFQHCNDNDFEYLLRMTLESLVSDGFFTFQCAAADENKLNQAYKQFVKDGHMFFRSKNQVMETIKLSGGELLSISDDILHPRECDIVWNIYRIRRLIKS